MSDILSNTIICPFCDIRVPKTSFGMHEAIHKRYRYLTCHYDLCTYGKNSRTSSGINFKSHCKNHIDPTSYLCVLCPERFEKREELLEHSRREGHEYETILEDIKVRKKITEEYTQPQVPNSYPILTDTSGRRPKGIIKAYNKGPRVPKASSSKGVTLSSIPNTQTSNDPTSSSIPNAQSSDIQLIPRIRALIVAPPFTELPNHVFGLDPGGGEENTLALEVVDIRCIYSERRQGEPLKVELETTNEGPNIVLGKELTFPGYKLTQKRKPGRPAKPRNAKEFMDDKTVKSFLLFRVSGNHQIEAWICLPEMPGGRKDGQRHTYFVLPITEEELAKERDVRKQALLGSTGNSESPSNFNGFTHDFKAYISTLLFPQFKPAVNQTSTDMPTAGLLGLSNLANSHPGHTIGVSAFDNTNTFSMMAETDSNGYSRNTNVPIPNTAYNQPYIPPSDFGPLPDMSNSSDDLGNQIYASQGNRDDTGVSSTFNAVPATIPTHFSLPTQQATPTYAQLASILQSLHKSNLVSEKLQSGSGISRTSSNSLTNRNTGQVPNRDSRKVHPYGNRPITSTSRLAAKSHSEQETEAHNDNSTQQQLYNETPTFAMPVPSQHYDLPQAMMQNFNASAGILGQEPQFTQQNFDVDYSFTFSGSGGDYANNSVYTGNDPNINDLFPNV